VRAKRNESPRAFALSRQAGRGSFKASPEREPLIISQRLTDEGDEMLAYERRARWIRRMQDRAARRREREWDRIVAAGAAGLWITPPGGPGSRRAA
jgi:hypothetical protein